MLRFAVFLAMILSAFPSARAETVSCFGDDIAPEVRQRIWAHLTAVDASIKSCPTSINDSSPVTVLVFGRHPLRKAFGLTAPEGQESFRLITHQHGTQRFYFAFGRTTYGSHVAAYALLEELGFAFLHPLKPYRPSQLHYPDIPDRLETPHLPVRAIHLHTQHPLELTNLLNGWGRSGYLDRQDWASMIPEWESYLEWSLANRQNHIAWYLLIADSWKDFGDSLERQDRLRALVDLGHRFGLSIGVTTPLVFRQQHAWTMIRQPGDELSQIDHALEWLSQIHFNYVEIEMGTSEFTHSHPEAMLNWMNHATAVASDLYGMEVWVKVHVSSGQTAKGFKDPQTGDDLNFNFLPYYADPRLTVMPHTVQIYGLQDPAPTYGNKDFSEISRYITMESGRRQILFYPESAYWVSYDIDVPLFLPIYAQRRLADLRGMGSKIQGQVLFSSGWEWTYWLNDVIAARASWNPFPELNDKDALAQSLEPFTRIFQDEGPALKHLLIEWIDAEEQLLIFGEVDGKRPANIEKRSGMAYLAGFDAWDDIADLLGSGITQPERKGLMDMRNPFSGGPSYDRELKPLLTAMRDQFRALSAKLSLHPQNPKLLEYASELHDAMRITALRAEQISQLYASVDTRMSSPWAGKKARNERAAAQKALDDALIITRNRASSYRVDADRITSWKNGPTSYPYGYLWTANKLFYWWRDEEKVTQMPISPCFRNIIDPIDTANGDGTWNIELPGLGELSVNALRERLTRLPGIGDSMETCFSKPVEEPQQSRNP